MTRRPPAPQALKLSPRLRALVEKLSHDIPAQCRRMQTVEREAIPDYHEVHDTAVARDVIDATLMHTQLWYQALLTGKTPSAKDLEPLAATGRRRMHQGFALSSLLHAIRIASMVLWDVLLESAGKDSAVRDELLLKVSPYLLQHFDVMGQAMSQAYTREQAQQARWRERLQHEMCAILFSHPDDVDGFRERAQTLGIDAATPHVALALRVGESAGMDSHMEASLERLLATVARCCKIERDAFLNTLRHGRVLVWLPVAMGESAIAAEARLAEQAAAIVRAGHGVVSAGVGLPDTGPRGWRSSAEQASKAIDLGAKLKAGERVLRYSDLALDHVTLGSDSVVRFLEGMIERLAAEPNLLETLTAYFEHRQHRKAVAGALSIHPNTLAYRLERIETLLGARLDDVGWLSRLYAALRLRQLHPPGGNGPE
jgi:carbohydrate diacid regulator